jgi:hypothetical protein
MVEKAPFSDFVAIGRHHDIDVLMLIAIRRNHRQRCCIPLPTGAAEGRARGQALGVTGAGRGQPHAAPTVPRRQIMGDQRRHLRRHVFAAEENTVVSGMDRLAGAQPQQESRRPPADGLRRAPGIDRCILPHVRLHKFTKLVHFAAIIENFGLSIIFSILVIFFGFVIEIKPKMP